MTDFNAIDILLKEADRYDNNMKTVPEFDYTEDFKKKWNEMFSDEKEFKGPLPTDAQERKGLPIATGVLFYFPLALAEVARVSRLGNDKHNPGQPLHWSRDKSSDHLDSAVRHIIDAGPNGDGEGVDGMHLANAIWRLAAELELVMEAKLERKNV